MSFVLDNSVTMRWLLPSPKQNDQDYAKAVLETLTGNEGEVPSLWHLEVANVLLGAEKRGDITLNASEVFITRLEMLPIYTDTETMNKAFSRTLNLGRAHGLSSYDASYLELAIRKSIPLATLDNDLRKAAIRAKVPIYLID